MPKNKSALIKIGYIIFIFIFLCASLPVSAHPGDLDSNGEHWNSETHTYHYHYSDKKEELRENIKITNKPTELFVGDEIKLKATIFIMDKDNKNVIWSSDNEEVATIDSNGVLSVHSAGTVTISAYPDAAYDGSLISDKFTITVEPHIKKSVTIPLPGTKELVLKVWEIYIALFIIVFLMIKLILYILNATNKKMTENQIYSYISCYLNRDEIYKQIEVYRKDKFIEDICRLSRPNSHKDLTCDEIDYECKQFNKSFRESLCKKSEPEIYTIYDLILYEIIDEYKQKVEPDKKGKYEFSQDEIHIIISKVLKQYIGEVEHHTPPHYPKTYIAVSELSRSIIVIFVIAILTLYAFMGFVLLGHEYTEIANGIKFIIGGLIFFSPLITNSIYTFLNRRIHSIYTSYKIKVFWISAFAAYGGIFILSYVILLFCR